MTLYLPSEIRAAFSEAIGDAEVIMLQSAPRTIGYCAGGIDAIVDALLDAISAARATLVVPTFTTDLTDPSIWKNRPESRERMDAIRRELPCYDAARSTPRNMGRIADLVWRRPRAHRSAHPVESIAAIGPRAQALTRVHPLDDPMGPRGPWARLVELDARILLLGVGLERCTMLHHCERMTDAIYEPLAAYAMPMSIEGERCWIEVERAGGNCSDGFGKLMPHLRAAGAVSEVTIGDAKTLAISSKKLFEVGCASLRRDAGALLCDGEECPQCVPARRMVKDALAPAFLDEPPLRR